jgi:hypothetical protein
MGSTEPIFGDDYRTPIRPTTIVDTNHTHTHYVWINPLGHDLYDNFEYIQQPLNPRDTPATEVRPSGQTIDHPIKQVVDPVVTSTKVHLNDGVITSIHTQGTSTTTPTFTHFHSTTPHVPQDPVGTSLHQRMKTLAR